MKIHAAFLSTVLLLPSVNVPANSQEKQASPAVAETSWTTQSSGTTLPLFSIHAVSENVAWAGGGTGSGTSGIALGTTNGGTTWLNAGNLSGDVFSIAGIDGVTAVAAVWTLSSAKVLKTTNGGNTWQTVDSTASGFYDNVVMLDATNGFLQGDPIGGNWLLKRTTNGGNTWFRTPFLPQIGSEAGWNGSMFWFDNLHGWFGTNNSRIYRTTDGGATWNSSQTTFVNSNALCFTTQLLGLAGSDTGPFNRTTNGGVTWTTGPAPLTSTISSISGVRGTEEFWAVTGGSMAYSTNAGDSWTTSGPNVYQGPCGVSGISMVTEGSNVFGWTVGAGCIAHYRRITTDVRKDGTRTPDHFSLSQNYPNPFNPVTSFQLSVSNPQLTIVKVYDVLGSEVATLMNELKPPGRYRLAWDASGFASGMYFVKLISGNFAQTRKILLLK